MQISLNPFDSGEVLLNPSKWGERLMPASWRIKVVDDAAESATIAMRSSVKYQQAMRDKNNEPEKIIRAEVVMNNLTSEDVGIHTDKASVKSPENNQAESNVLNVDALREAVDRSYGGVG